MPPLVVDDVDGAEIRVAGRWSVDFTSTPYLSLGPLDGFGRGARSSFARLASAQATARLAWRSRLATDVEARLVAQARAPAALVASSVLVLLLDAVSLLLRPRRLLLLGEEASTIHGAVAERARATGARVAACRPHQVERLERLLARRDSAPAAVLVQAISSNGRAAPLRLIAERCAAARAWLIVDDSLGFGLLGRPAPGTAYGLGGGGSLAWTETEFHPRLLLVASLTRAFGIPLAFAAGSSAALAALGATHTLTASSALDPWCVARASRALTLAASSGEEARRSLADAVVQLDEAAKTHGWSAFPLRTREFDSRRAAQRYHTALRSRGIHASLDAPGLRVRFALGSAHAGPLLARALHRIASVD